jgi:hypothetical protein
MLAFVDLIHALPTRGRDCTQFLLWGERSCRGSLASRGEKLGEMHLGGVLHQGEKNWEKCICSGGACIHVLWSSLSTDFSCALFANGVEPFLPHIEESASLEHFISVVSSRCPCQRGHRFSPSSDIVLAFVWFLITCLSFSFISFLFLFL